MATSRTGSSSSSTTLKTSSSEADFQMILNERKRKRMVSNREAARRSRMRKQKHLDDLTSQVCQLTNENNQILTNIDMTRQVYLNIEAENLILRAQMAELSTRLQSLNEIVHFVSSSNGVLGYESYAHHQNYSYETGHHNHQVNEDTFMINNTWGCFSVNQPIIASTDMIMY